MGRGSVEGERDGVEVDGRGVVGGRRGASRVMATADQIIAEIRALDLLDASDTEDPALEFIYPTLDALMCAGDFATVNAVLASGVADLSTVALLGLLSITSPAAPSLAQRTTFARDVRAKLTWRYPERVDELMRGLD